MTDMNAIRPYPASAHRRSLPPLYLAWLAYATFVVYGSLVPLDYHPRPWEEAWWLFQHIRLLDVGMQGRADWVANGVLYLPLAFLSVQAFAGGRSRPSPVAMLLGLLFSLALAVTVEFVQLFFPPRTVSLNDLLAEGIGSLLGTAVATTWGGRFRRLLGALMGEPAHLPTRLLKAYALGYLAFSLFPYDFLVSAAELAAKARSDAWGWLFADDAWRGSLLTSVAKPLGEALAVVPLGILAQRMRPGPRHWTSTRTLAAGAMLGLLVETAQFFIVSGVSQGLSVITRAVGLYVGTWLARWTAALHPSRLAALARGHLPAIGGLYLIVLAALNGWFDHRWMGLEHAANTLDELHFLPFYYHYYTTEQAALLSLTSVCLMYAPIGLFTWATWWPPALAMLLAGMTAGFMEIGKLFLEGLRPDPTNVLLAGLAAWAGAHLVRRLACAARLPSATGGTSVAAGSVAIAPRKERTPPREGMRRDGVPRQPLRSTTQTALRTPSLPGLILLTFGMAVVAAGVLTFPVQPILLGLFLAGYAALLWRRPRTMLVALPAALPLLDLAPWSGRFLLDEFDLMLLTTLIIGYVRLPPRSRRRRTDPLLRMALGLVLLAYAVGVARALLPLSSPDVDALNHYLGEFNALRVAKGALWAWLLFGLARRLRTGLAEMAPQLAVGFSMGLAGTVAVVLWERLAFPGLFDFVDVYRVTGPFSQMHTGGADLETYLALAVPFTLHLVLSRGTWSLRIGGGLLLAATTYAMMVTFARIGYVAFAVAIVLTLSLWFRGRSRPAGASPHRSAVVMAALGAMAVAVAVPVWHGAFTQQRLASTGADLETRIAHWKAVLAMRDPDWATSAFGMGLGRYPQTHAWRGEGRRAATYRLKREGDDSFLRLGSGSPVYIEQFVSARPRQKYRLRLELRGAAPDAALSVSLCEKWLLTSARCRFLRIAAPAPGQWVRTNDIELATGDIGDTPWFAPRPIKLSLYNAEAGKAVDVDGVRLTSPEGRELLVNGEFEQGMDHWFFSVDNDLPWHVWSLPITLLFELGWFGLIAFTLLFALALVRSARASWRGEAWACAFFAAVSAYLVLGTVDGLVDSPRMLLLGLLLASLAARAHRATGRGTPLRTERPMPR